jgi:hypothetical protein
MDEIDEIYNCSGLKYGTYMVFIKYWTKKDSIKD